jgi:23S rRNA (cytidine1920-2'-O)/16S rRNA (cytidine1409-2'-O)-methyltransferase
LTPQKPLRLDAELVRRGLARSRAEAKRAIEEGRVDVQGIPVLRATAQVRADTSIALREPGPRFVSRGGEKLDGALDRFGLDVSGKAWLDAGASTGGFTDRLLRGGATRVVAVDVGYGQLDWALRTDPRVAVIERTNVRHLRPADVPFPIDGVVADLSFISLRVVLPALVSVASSTADFVLLVKPQFELERGAVGRGGVVREPDSWRRAITGVVRAGEGLSLEVVDVAPALPPGPAGNREFFLRARRSTRPDPASADAAIQSAVSEASQ